MWCVFRKLILFLLVAGSFFAGGQQVLRVGIQTVADPNLLLAPTFEAVASSLGQQALVKSLQTEADMYNAVRDGTIDYLVSGGSFVNCLQAQYGIIPIANQLTIEGTESTSSLGGAIVTLADSGIKSIQDIRNQRVAIIQLNTLFGCQAQWGEMFKAGLNLFIDTKLVLITGSTLDTILSVYAGFADVGFIAAGQLEALAAKGLIPYDAFSFVNIQNDSFPFTTSTVLYPGVFISALNTTSQIQRKAVTKILYNITETDNFALSANYSAWLLPQNLQPLLDLQNHLGVFIVDPLKLNSAHCFREDDVNDFTLCPVGFSRLSSADIPKSCAIQQIPCPNNNVCICGPCIPTPHKKKHVWVIAPILVVILAVLSGILWKFVMRVHVPTICYSDLELTKDSEVLGENDFGKVLKASYFGTAVAVKRALPKQHKELSVFDSPSMITRAHQSKGESWTRFLPGNVSPADAKAKEVWSAVKHSHPNILHIFGISTASNSSDVLIVNKFMHYGTLYDILQNMTLPLDMQMMAVILRDVASGLAYLHSNKMFSKVGNRLRSHRIYVDENWRCKIKLITMEDEDDLRQRLWQAPENAGKSSTLPSEKSDVYSYGMLMYEVLYRKVPYDTEEPSRVLNNWAPPVFDTTKTDGLHLLMQRCWALDPAARPSLEYILENLQRFGTGNLADLLRVDSHHKSKLLLQNLPPALARNLRQEVRVELAVFPVVTVLVMRMHSDEANSATSARKLVLFKALDQEAAAHGFFKLNTTDSSYVLASNLSGPQMDHCSKMASFATKSISIMKSKNVQLLTGMHTGPLVANLIGGNTPTLTLFGNTMTVASCMCATSQENSIQVSESFHNHLVAENASITSILGKRMGNQFVASQGSIVSYWLLHDNDATNKRLDSRAEANHTLDTSFNTSSRT